MTTTTTSVLVPARFNGPPSSGNGGWTAGALVAAAGLGPATVQLRQPPPLDVSMALADRDGWIEATRDGVVVLRARAADHEVEPVEPVDAATAGAAEAGYAGHSSHPFPGCYVCGVARPDGMRIFPGRVADDSHGRVRTAATWTPAPGIAPDLASTWAALDCIGGWAGDLAERLMVLGTMTASVTSLPEPGVPHVVVGGARGVEGRKTFTNATLYDPQGQAIGSAEHVWIAVDPSTFA